MHLVPQARVEVDPIGRALENQLRWFPDLEGTCDRLEELAPDPQAVKRRFDGSLVDPGVLSELSVHLGCVLVKLPVDSQVVILGPRLSRRHLTEPAVARWASHDDADQDLIHVSAQNDSLDFTP